jgi:dTDP-4-dehydrorhamnose reductase
MKEKNFEPFVSGYDLFGDLQLQERVWLRMHVLVTGSKGQVGRELMDRGTRSGMTMEGVDIEDLDISDFAAVLRKVRDMNPSVVVNAAAYTAVDQAETDTDTAYAVNRDGSRNLAEACAQKGIPLIHISTDYVYSGTKKGAYFEDDPMAPAGVYAKSKAEGDREVSGRLKEYIILRTAWLYSIYGHNFVKTMLKLGHEKEVLRVVDDQFGCPTDAADLAEAILLIARKIQENEPVSWGIYHYCGKGRTSWHGFAKKIFEISENYDSFLIKSIQGIPTREYPTPAMRPVNSELDCSKIENTFGVALRPWEESLSSMLRRLYTA